MINSVDSSTLNVVLNNSKTQETQQTKAASVISASDTSLATAQSSAALNTDTLELSTDAQSYLDTINSESDASSEVTVSESTEETDTVDELYTYTESELRKMLALGEISQSEYDAEMASRSAT